MIALAPAVPSFTQPIGGMPWFWRDLEAERIGEVLPLVMAADPGGTEATYWLRDARDRLAAASSGGGVVIVQCLAGLTLALFFHSRGMTPDSRPRLVVDRLRWLELGRPHRSLDALVASVLQTARRLGCADVLLEAGACVEGRARAALDQQVREAGFVAEGGGWRCPTPAAF